MMKGYDQSTVSGQYARGIVFFLFVIEHDTYIRPILLLFPILSNVQLSDERKFNGIKIGTKLL